ncbi:MAG: IS21 family transposase [Lachnospiraceae bacterium]|nr:IS21 family transposase [Lachnospiraceae bacterium]
MKREQGENFDINKVNLAEMERRTGISRMKLRRLKENGFVDLPDARVGRKAERTVLTGYTGVLDTLLRKGISNSSVCLEKLKDVGYTGGLTTVKSYISAHKDLIPAKRQMVAPQGNRGRRYQTEPGDSYQMDWGFVNVEDQFGNTTQLACFAMICHGCSQRYIEFFPNARQENLFIGMIHAFAYMGIPKHVLTDNMKSVVIRRDEQGHPIWQPDYELFMGNLCFETKLCKPRHPFTKGAVERLVRFVKDNFIQGRVFTELTDLNYEARRWCDRQNTVYHRAVDCVPNDKHNALCMKTAEKLEMTPELSYYLCPERKISFDGFINYEGRRFGVPYWYTEKTCRVSRDGYILYIYATDMSKVLTTHDVTWSRRDSFCKDQYTTEQPEEQPTAPVKVSMERRDSQEHVSGFERFNFEEGL